MQIKINSAVHFLQTDCEVDLFDYNLATNPSIDIDLMVNLCISGQRILLDKCKLPEDKGAAIAEAIQNNTTRAVCNSSFDDERGFAVTPAFIIVPRLRKIVV